MASQLMMQMVEENDVGCGPVCFRSSVCRLHILSNPRWYVEVLMLAIPHVDESRWRIIASEDRGPCSVQGVK